MMKELILQRILFGLKNIVLACVLGALALDISVAEGVEETENTLIPEGEAGWKDVCIKLIQRGDEKAEIALKALLLPLAEGGDTTAQMLLDVREDDRSKGDWIEKAVKQGDPDALWIAGILSNEDTEKCMEYWNKAAAAGHIGAQWELAYAALCGTPLMRALRRFDGFVPDPQPCIKLAEKGYVMATCALAEYYRSEEWKSDAAAEWSAKAAEMGDAVSMWYLAYMNIEGLGSDDDESDSEDDEGNKKRTRVRRSKSKKAIVRPTTRRPYKAGSNKWEKMLYGSANRGYYRALRDMMHLLLDPTQIKARLVMYYLALENLNYIELSPHVIWMDHVRLDAFDAYTNRISALDNEYIKLREKGCGGDDSFWDKMEALAKKGHTESIYDVGRRHETQMGGQNDERDAEHRAAAIRWYRKAVKAKHVAAHERLGCLLEDDPQNDKEVFKLYKYAASMDIASAKTRLGMCYLKGKGTTADPKKAAKCFSEAAEYWDAGGLYELALCYYNGWGVNRDVKKARELINRYMNIIGYYSVNFSSSLGITWHIKDNRERYHPFLRKLDEQKIRRLNRDAVSLYLLLRGEG